MCLLLRTFQRAFQSLPGILFLKPGGSMAAIIAMEYRQSRRLGTAWSFCASGAGRAAANREYFANAREPPGRAQDVEWEGVIIRIG